MSSCYSTPTNLKPSSTLKLLSSTTTYSKHTPVPHLQASGIRCVASTTARDVVEEGGVKVSKFRFVRFREYPN